MEYNTGLLSAVLQHYAALRGTCTCLILSCVWGVKLLGGVCVRQSAGIRPRELASRRAKSWDDVTRQRGGEISVRHRSIHRKQA